MSIKLRSYLDLPKADPMTDVAAASSPTDDRFPRGQVIDMAKTLGGALLVALVLRVLVFQPFTIPSDSMEPLLLKGDYLVIWKWPYGISRYSIPFTPPLFRGRILGAAPHRGDVVVFSHALNGHRQDYIKRVIGLPGDQIQVRESRLFINGVAVQREVLGPATDPDDASRAVTQVRETLPDGHSWITFVEAPDHIGETTGIYVVPKNRIFVMGDNRDNSLDSRWPAGVGMGFIPTEEVEGKAAIILASWKGGATWNPWTWISRFEFHRAFDPVR